MPSPIFRPRSLRWTFHTQSNFYIDVKIDRWVEGGRRVAGLFIGLAPNAKARRPH
jgi:hypothetical protein